MSAVLARPAAVNVHLCEHCEQPITGVRIHAAIRVMPGGTPVRYGRDFHPECYREINEDAFV